MRLALARTLFSKPDLLLLDEPTNMLDMQAVIWLERYLQTWGGTIIVVSHDRMFLDEVATDILHIHSRKIDTYRGNYSEYYHTMTEKLLNQQREYDSQMDYRKHIQEFIDKFRFVFLFHTLSFHSDFSQVQCQESHSCPIPNQGSGEASCLGEGDY